MNDESIQQLTQRLEMRERQIDAVHRISAALFSKSDIDELLRETLNVSLETVDADAGSILLYDPDKRKLVFRYVIGKTELIGQDIDPEHATAKAAAVFRSGESLLLADTRVETYNQEFDRATGFRTESILTVPLKNIGGEPIGVMQALNKRHGNFDVADQDLLEIVSGLAATTIMNAHLAKEAELAAVARAVGDLGHDIKNALTPIETMMDTTVEAFIEPMYADLDTLIASGATDIQGVLDATLPLRDWYPEVRGAVRDGCSDIREMVTAIADYVKGTQATYMETNDVQAIVEDRLRRVRVVAQTRRVVIHLVCPEPVAPFPFDRRLLGRAVFNLVNNALIAVSDAVKKKTLELRPEGFNIWVKISAVAEGEFPDGGYCLVEVQDDGPGIPPRVKASLFTEKVMSTSVGGTGIGTRFVKSVADAHAGQVGVESEPGCGARFWLKLPLSQAETAV